AIDDAQAVTMRPLRNPVRKSSYASALANHRQDQASGGKEMMALLLKAASVTTTAGNRTKPRMASTVMPPTPRRSPGMSMRPQSCERACGHTHQRQDCEGENEPGNRQTRCERKVEARKPELIDQVCDHIDAPTADQLRGCKCAEGPRKRGSDAGDD